MRSRFAAAAVLALAAVTIGGGAAFAHGGFSPGSKTAASDVSTTQAASHPSAPHVRQVEAAEPGDVPEVTETEPDDDNLTTTTTVIPTGAAPVVSTATGDGHEGRDGLDGDHGRDDQGRDGNDTTTSMTMRTSTSTSTLPTTTTTEEHEQGDQDGAPPVGTTPVTAHHQDEDGDRDGGGPTPSGVGNEEARGGDRGPGDGHDGD